MATMLRAATRTARKDHQCDWCLQTIEARTVYRCDSYAHDGEAYTLRMHPECRGACMECDDCGDGVPMERASRGWTIAETEYARPPSPETIAARRGAALREVR